MATFTFPSITPSFSRWGIRSNAVIQESEFTNAIKTLDRDGERWEVELRFNNLTADEKAEMEAFLVKVNGPANRVRFGKHSHVQRGAFGGSPLVDGGSQTGNTLEIDGCTASISDWIKEGDMFSVNNELKMSIADENSDSGGELTLDFKPKLRASPADNAVITTANPTGVFVLINPLTAWSNKPGNFSDFVIQAVEDIVP